MGFKKLCYYFWNFSVNLKLYEIKGNIYTRKCNSGGSYSEESEFSMRGVIYFFKSFYKSGMPTDSKWPGIVKIYGGCLNKIINSAFFQSQKYL